MKKWWKIVLILWVSILVLWWVRAWLTKAWVIPNYFDIELLCPGTWNYDRRDPDCSKKCYKECKKHENEPFWYLCWNECISKCEMQKRNICLSSCEIPDMWEELNTYYAKEYYSYWCKEQYTWNNGSSECYSSMFGLWGDSLSYEKHYEEWIDEMFDGYQDELKEYESCRKSCWGNPAMMLVDKPIIYLYPKVESEINVKLWIPEKLLHTYPKYNIEKWWDVIAQPNGYLEYKETWRKLYALYREWKTYNKDNFNEWFVVDWKDIIPFLEEKLEILWLNEREIEEFIVYWLPQMEWNEWNLIRFETIEVHNDNMPLIITPTPDTIIRVMMDWKAIDNPIEIPEQKLVTPERIWFTVVERWGSLKN